VCSLAEVFSLNPSLSALDGLQYARWADPGIGARSVKGVSASFLTPLTGLRKKATRDGPIQQHLGSGACTRHRHDEIALLSALATSCSDRAEFVIDCRCRKIVTKMYS
jgi:hypothetical protein